MAGLYPREHYIFELEGKKFLFEVNTLKAYEIDELMADLLTLREPLTIEEVVSKLGPSYGEAELRSLWDLLVTEGILLKEKEPPIVDLEKRKEVTEQTIYLHSLVINIAQKCNLHCTYCYADHGVYNGPERNMTQETAEASIDFLLAASGTEKRCFAVFFGGEPLLNFEVLKHAVNYGKKRAQELGKDLQFGITTNGTVFTEEIVDFLDEHQFSVVVSLDGPKDVQDAQRPMLDGRGSYERIIPWLQKMRDRKGLNLGCRSTMSPHYVNLLALDEFFAGEGIGFYHIELATIGPHMGPEAAALLPSRLDEFMFQYGELVKRVWRRIQAKDFIGFRTIFFDLNRLEKRHIWYFPCGMGTKVLLVSADGKIYACHRLVGMAEHVLGSVFEKDIIEKVRRFRPLSIVEKAGCPQCWIRNICAGDCPAESIIIKGDERKPVPHRCFLRQKRMEWAIWLYSMIRSLPDQDLAGRILSQEFMVNGLYD